MNCFIKNRLTFKTITVCPVINYELTYWSIYDEVSSLDVAVEKQKLFSEGDIVVAGRYLGLIKEISRDGSLATLKCEHIVKLFDRDLVYGNGPDAAGIEAFLKNALDDNFANLNDSVYRLPYLSIIAPTATASTMGPDVEGGIWNIKSYIAKVRRIHNIFTTFNATRERLAVEIRQASIVKKNMDLSNPVVQIIEESYSNRAVGKITSYEPETGVIRDWYLLEGGEITSIYQSDNRVKGTWELLEIRKAEETEYEVRDYFAKNSFSHKVLVSIPKKYARYNFYDRILIAHDGRLYSSYIAAIRETKNNSWTEYQCGELRTTLTDKIQEDL